MRKLSDTIPGEIIEVISVDDDFARIQALRFGINPGAVVSTTAKLPSGPIVIKSGRQEIAIGRSLAEKIGVRDGR